MAALVERQQEEGLGPEGRLDAARAGRAGAFSFGLVVGALVLGYAALRLFELAPRSAVPASAEGATPLVAVEPEAWLAQLTLGTARIRARLLPLHDEPVLEEFRAAALRERYALPEGRPWRLYLALEEATDAPVLVRTARATGLVPLTELVGAPAGIDPVLALLTAAPGALEYGRARPMVLWGRPVLEGDELEVEGEAATASGVLRRASAEGESEPAPRWYAGRALPPREASSLEQEVARLEAELELERARRAEREQAFLEFSRLLGELPAGRALGLEPGALATAPEPPTPEEEERRAAEEDRRARAEELGRALAVLMRLEGLRGLDLMDAGTLQPGPPVALGPVVFRCLDERGLLTGSLRAERLRLSGSHSAHTLTLILEEGFESRTGAREPFENGERRITLRDVDPEPWIAECPELFAPDELVRPHDDGRWVLSEVRREFNRLLALDPRFGWYRLHSLGGVLGAELRDVQLEQLQADGHVERRLFADRLTLALEDGSLVLELVDGAFVRGEEKQPFRNGRHRIVLPGVAQEVWRAASLPGFAPAPAREKAAEPGPAGG